VSTDWFIDQVLSKYNYWVSVALMLIGFYGILAKDNLIKKVIGLSIFQTAIFLYFISLGAVKGGTAPIVSEEIIRKGYVYANPLPHVLILTAIVVSVATAAVALSLIIRMHDEYGSIEESEIINRLKTVNTAGSKNTEPSL
jgi:multicomponent Na+:H+ antiporter subunit C